MDSNKWKPGLMETLSNGCLPLSLHTKRFAVGDGEASTLLLTPMSSAPQACCSQGPPHPRLPGVFVLLPLADFPPHGEWWELLGWGSFSRGQNEFLERHTVLCSVRL